MYAIYRISLNSSYTCLVFIHIAILLGFIELCKLLNNMCLVLVSLPLYNYIQKRKKVYIKPLETKHLHKYVNFYCKKAVDQSSINRAPGKRWISEYRVRFLYILLSDTIFMCEKSLIMFMMVFCC